MTMKSKFSQLRCETKINITASSSGYNYRPSACCLSWVFVQPHYTPLIFRGGSVADHPGLMPGRLEHILFAAFHCHSKWQWRHCNDGRRGPWWKAVTKQRSRGSLSGALDIRRGCPLQQLMAARGPWEDGPKGLGQLRSCDPSTLPCRGCPGQGTYRRNLRGGMKADQDRDNRWETIRAQCGGMNPGNLAIFMNSSHEQQKRELCEGRRLSPRTNSTYKPATGTYPGQIPYTVTIGTRE